MKVVFTPRSEADLSALYDYIADNSSLRIAGEYVASIQAACLMLADFPRRGVSRPDLGDRIHIIPFQGRAVIAYRPDDDRVRILRDSQQDGIWSSGFLAMPTPPWRP